MRKLITEVLVTVTAALTFAFAFQTVAFATFYIPSESMVPTLQVGDRITAAKFAYGWSRNAPAFGVTLPDSIHGRLFGREPSRGDVVVFIHPRSGDRMIKRLIGLPGDRIAVRDGHVVLNGTPVPTRYKRTYTFHEYKGDAVQVKAFEEHLPGARPHEIIVRTDHGVIGDMIERTVPDGHYFMMGDNRDNSADSRFASMGVVPAENLVARAEAIIYSCYSCSHEEGMVCADRRFGRLLR